ncbi:hypothetical protein [Streptomyces sp. WAC06614]|uniref:hypothetical protein n=1 Tax=Streptomyces sp. WAC06614 TaxID=2487416 RepID=UPI000F777577|nr:hypothetical protein [Streptomyces sp. WAC06614]RSS68316.1 hypothetical protein EF918_28365 [Streptomyces sp. WAC06614]
MTDFRDDGPVPVRDGDTQRRVRRSPLLHTAPIVLLAVLTAVLGWEIVRANMSAAARTQWPWRLQLLDMEPLGSLLAVAAGAVLARAQYARTVRPSLGWRADWTTGQLHGGAPEWRVGLLNGGSHTAVIEDYACRVVLRGGPPGAGGAWTDVQGAAAALTAAGLTAGEDFQLVQMGNFPLVPAGGGYDTATVGAFSRRFVDEVEALYLRVRVTDAVGDSHERIMDALKGARSAAYRRPAT